MAFTKIEKASHGGRKSRPGPVTLYTTKTSRMVVIAKDIANKVNIREGDAVDFFEGTGTDYGWFAVTRAGVNSGGRSVRKHGKSGDVCITLPSNISVPLAETHRPAACFHQVVGNHLNVEFPASMVTAPALAAAE